MPVMNKLRRPQMGRVCSCPRSKLATKGEGNKTQHHRCALSQAIGLQPTSERKKLPASHNVMLSVT